ncbi:MAG: hypothetical protein ND807_07795 [Vicinamibacterales bacterium]|nr:hypothetical protein [Vicinamibacterales bacterium]
MRTIHVRSLSVAAFMLLAFVGTARAQTLLSTFEVQQLVARGEPSDNAKLSAHFATLADRYTAEARQHESMSRSFLGNPSRNLVAGMSEHCMRLAKLNTESATTVRDLAVHHQKLAEGVPSLAPHDAAHFQGGAGATKVTVQDINRLAATAKTTADHHALQEYFQTLAKRYNAEAKDQTAIAQSYRGTKIAQVGVNFDRLAALSRDSAKEATEAAAVHGDLAGTGR